MAAEVLDSNLRSAGVRAIVTSRAKSPTRLEAKVRQRASYKDYKTVDQIYDDIIDLAGIRVALYFPAERDEVGKIITSLFPIIGDCKSLFGNEIQPLLKPEKPSNQLSFQIMEEFDD